VLTIQDDPGALVAWRPRVARFLDVLERFGSAELAHDARAHRQLLVTVDVADILALVATQPAA
jgi:hypothetical protein